MAYDGAPEEELYDEDASMGDDDLDPVLPPDLPLDDELELVLPADLPLAAEPDLPPGLPPAAGLDLPPGLPPVAEPAPALAPPGDEAAPGAQPPALIAAPAAQPPAVGLARAALPPADAPAPVRRAGIFKGTINFFTPARGGGIIDYFEIVEGWRVDKTIWYRKMGCLGPDDFPLAATDDPAPGQRVHFCITADEQGRPLAHAVAAPCGGPVKIMARRNKRHRGH
jgi:hypothetical protein